VRHASCTPASLCLSLTSPHISRINTPPPAVPVAVNSSYRPTRSPSQTPLETPKHHSATPSGLVRRAPRLLLHTTAVHLRLAEKCASTRPNPSLASLACCPLFRDPRDQPSAQADRQPIYRQSIRLPCDSLRLLALCTRIPRSPSVRRTIVRGA
jgi:hypothetical protein